MNRLHSLGRLALLVCLAGAGARLAAEDTKAGPDEIQALVKTLGDEDFEKREAAEKKLADLGPAAFDALRRAAAHGDTEELQTRAGKLAQKLVQAEQAKGWKRARVPLSGISFLGGGAGILAVGSAGVARLVIPGDKATQVEAVDEGVRVLHGEGKAKLEIVESLAGLRVTQGETVVKAVDGDDLEKVNPGLAQRCRSVCLAIPLDFNDAQLLTDSSKPWNGTLDEHLKAMDAAFERVAAKVKAAEMDETVRTALLKGLDAQKAGNTERLRKAAEETKK